LQEFKQTARDALCQDKFAVLMETASLTAQELSEYCRNKGLYPEERWKQTFIQGFSPSTSEPRPLVRKDPQLDTYWSPCFKSGKSA